MPQFPVTPIPGDVNASSIPEVIIWLDKMGERGVINATSSRLKVSALERLVDILGDDEDHRARAVLDNIDSIANRWATKNSANPETTSTYLSRAKSALADFFKYQEDPSKFKSKQRPVAVAKSEKPESKEAEIEAEVELPSPRPAARNDKLRSFPLDGDREVFFQIPPDLTEREAGRFSAHLLTFVRDFDLTNPEHRRVFNMLRGAAEQ